MVRSTQVPAARADHTCVQQPLEPAGAPEAWDGLDADARAWLADQLGPPAHVPPAGAMPSPTRLEEAVGVGPGDGTLLRSLLDAMVGMHASDLHLAPGIPPHVRTVGELRPLQGAPVLRGDEIAAMLQAAVTPSQWQTLLAEGELELTFELPGRARFRAAVFREGAGLAAAIRQIPEDVPALASLGLPPVIERLTELRRGLVLVTGITGSGKSTTLAAMIDHINITRSEHILTVEDPVEFRHRHKRSVVNQRQVGQHTASFAMALRAALRQDPDVILVGEMRDLETIQIALTAAETGHLVLATLHSTDAASTVNRLVDVFPPAQQGQVRAQLAGTLQAVVSQQLVPTVDQRRRVVAAEILVATTGVRNLIREEKIHQIPAVLETSARDGMQTMTQALADLVRRGVIAHHVARARCPHPEILDRLLQP
jgi:twitching motility protein PilT